MHLIVKHEIYRATSLVKAAKPLLLSGIATIFLVQVLIVESSAMLKLPLTRANIGLPQAVPVTGSILFTWRRYLKMSLIILIEIISLVFCIGSNWIRFRHWRRSPCSGWRARNFYPEYN